MKKLGKKPAESEKTAVIGRPASENPRNLRIPVRVSRPELDWLIAEASRRGESLTDHARKRLGLPLTGYGRAG